jgi:phenylacetate-coenzyme A ligase PaaK-like adenylate-forming protein
MEVFGRSNDMQRVPLAKVFASFFKKKRLLA